MRPLLHLDDLHPGSDQARSWAQEELSRPDYQMSLWDRFLEWLFGTPTPTGNGGLALAPVAAVLATLVVAILLTLVVRRVRRIPREVAVPVGAVLGDEALTAADYRRRAALARAEGDFRAAVIDGFRAVAAAAIEHGDLAAVPGMTADELADILRTRHGTHTSLVALLATSAEVFDRTLYGAHAADSGDASRMAALDEAFEALPRTRSASASGMSTSGMSTSGTHG